MDNGKNERIAAKEFDDFQAAWRTMFEQDEPLVMVVGALFGMTNLGEYPVESRRLAQILGRTVPEAETLARQYGWPGVQVRDGLISLNPARAKVAARRQVQIGDRRFGLSGCGPDLVLYGGLVRPSLHVDDTCPTTGARIQIEFTPEGVARVDPPDTAVAMINPRGLDLSGKNIDEIDANVCVQMPFFASAEAAQGWLTDHPSGRVFTVREAWNLSFFRDLRDNISALLSIAA